jgi:hypothetical protein
VTYFNPTSLSEEGTMLMTLFRAVTARVAGLFAAAAAADLEAALLARDAERRAELARQADGYDAEGLAGVADRLRGQAAGLAADRPAGAVLPALDHLLRGAGPGAAEPAALPAAARHKGR